MTRLYVSSCWDDIPTLIDGQYWMVCGTVRDERAVVRRTSSDGYRYLESREIKKGETATFSTGQRVKVTYVSADRYADISVYPPLPVIEYCTQQFEIFDQDGNPLNGTISCPEWDTDLPVPNTGKASMTFVKGVIYTATVHSNGLTDTHTFTTCQSPVTFIINIQPEPEVKEMEDIVNGDKFNIISRSFPESAKQGERYSIRLTIEHLRLYGDKCLVKLYNSQYPAKLITTKSFSFIGWEEKDFDFSLIMGTDDQYYRVIVMDDNPITIDTVQDGFNAMVRYEATIIDPGEPLCTQEFHTSLDNVGARGKVTIGGQDYYTDGEGFGSATLIKGVGLIAVARIGALSLSKSFTSCTGSILSFSLKSPYVPPVEPVDPVDPYVPPDPDDTDEPVLDDNTMLYLFLFIIAMVIFMGKLK